MLSKNSTNAGYIQSPYTTMQIQRSLYSFLPALLFSLLISAACHTRQTPSDKPVMVESPEKMKSAVVDLIQSHLEAAGTTGKITEDSVALRQPAAVQYLYEQHGGNPLWAEKESWLPIGDSLLRFIDSCRYYGLFPGDYHQKDITVIRNRFLADSLSTGDRRDANLWSRADLLMTDAFLQLIGDIKLGRLPNDSISLRKDSILSNEFLAAQYEKIKEQGFTATISALEPAALGYRQLKEGIRKFLATADDQEYTQVPSAKTPGFKALLQKRLTEGNYLPADNQVADSAHLADAVKKFQKEKGMTVDGVAGDATIRMLNVSDRERFIRIAISLDKYKLLPDTMPEKYIWVNTSGNYLQVMDHDSVKLYSKVICGKTTTRTPLLTSAISSLITYPQWVPPPSIIKKEILPAVKRNPGYLAKKGFSLLNSKGEEVDPYSVDWTKYNNSMHYKVVQGSGDANALGIMKFHFDNKYSVYLHDTNQRYLFANAMRSLSHGCVRVQEWEKLTWYIIRNDSLLSGGRNYVKTDSIRTWLQRKEKKTIAIRNKLPVFIRYFTCEGKNGGIVFYDDVYGDDKYLREKYFASK